MSAFDWALLAAASGYLTDKTIAVFKIKKEPVNGITIYGVVLTVLYVAKQSITG